MASLQTYIRYTIWKIQLTLLMVVTMHIPFLTRSTHSSRFQGGLPNEQLLDVVHGLEMIKCAILSFITTSAPVGID